MEAGIETLECGASQGNASRKVALLLKREQLLYDIRNYCYVEGHIMEGGEGEMSHSVQDVGEIGNVDRVTRVLDVAFADIVERLHPMTRRDITVPLQDDRLRERKVYGVMLQVPNDYSQTTVNLLGKLIHELLVTTAVADWLSITHPPKAGVWREKAEAVMTRIGQIRNRRQGRSRLRPRWL